MRSQSFVSILSVSAILILLISNSLNVNANDKNGCKWVGGKVGWSCGNHSSREVWRGYRHVAYNGRIYCVNNYRKNVRMICKRRNS